MKFFLLENACPIVSDNRDLPLQSFRSKAPALPKPRPHFPGGSQSRGLLAGGLSSAPPASPQGCPVTPGQGSWLPAEQSPEGQVGAVESLVTQPWKPHTLAPTGSYGGTGQAWGPGWAGPIPGMNSRRQVMGPTLPATSPTSHSPETRESRLCQRRHLQGTRGHDPLTLPAPPPDPSGVPRGHCPEVLTVRGAPGGYRVRAKGHSTKDSHKCQQEESSEAQDVQKDMRIKIRLEPAEPGGPLPAPAASPLACLPPPPPGLRSLPQDWGDWGARARTGGTGERAGPSLPACSSSSGPGLAAVCPMLEHSLRAGKGLGPTPRGLG